MRTVATALPAKFGHARGLTHETVDPDDEAHTVEQVWPVRLQTSGEGREPRAGHTGSALGGDDHEHQEGDLLADAERLVPAPRR